MARQRIRKTKLVATIGPACDSPEAIKAMIRAGMDVARLNFSHGTHEEHRKRLECLRQACTELAANVAVMLDTKGVKIRTGRVAGGAVVLETGSPFTLYTDGRLGDAQGASVSYEALPEQVEPGSTILLDDGVIELEVLAVEPSAIRCRIRRGGRLQDRKGVNLPGAALGGVPAMSPENRADLAFAVREDIDYVAASFVRSSADVREIRRVLQEHGGGRIPIIAKIESASGVAKLDEIVAEADGVMVARGDLGVELPLQEVPIVQKKIIRATVMNGKPVITATQMLDSMQRNPTPTRAEVSDVANAIFDGTSAVMLSNETAVGAYPVEAVRTMATLALEAEASLDEYGHLQQIRAEGSNVVTDAVSQAAITMATHLRAAAIVALTESGFTARAISKYRPSCPILGVTRWERVARRFAMNWGVTGVRFEGEDLSDAAQIAFAVERAVQLGIAEPGDVVVATSGVGRETGSTNLIRVVSVGPARA
ncbi:MAG TPA: pyruvate kinase [Myxococcota bacterium]|nr:pyruvate kinase [Myxococcota bacterium]